MRHDFQPKRYLSPTRTIVSIIARIYTQEFFYSVTFLVVLFLNVKNSNILFFAALYILRHFLQRNPFFSTKNRNCMSFDLSCEYLILKKDHIQFIFFEICLFARFFNSSSQSNKSLYIFFLEYSEIFIRNIQEIRTRNH